MLTAEHKEYIRKHCHTTTVYKMAKAMGKSYRIVERFMRLEGLAPLKPCRDTIGFTCTPPDSCFNCPFDDCIKGLSQVRQTKRELQFQAMCGIDTVRHRNGQTHKTTEKISKEAENDK